MDCEFLNRLSSPGLKNVCGFRSFSYFSSYENIQHLLLLLL